MRVEEEMLITPEQRGASESDHQSRACNRDKNEVKGGVCCYASLIAASWSASFSAASSPVSAPPPLAVPCAAPSFPPPFPPNGSITVFTQSLAASFELEFWCIE